jgi:hypothetical protein
MRPEPHERTTRPGLGQSKTATWAAPRKAQSEAKPLSRSAAVPRKEAPVVAIATKD